ncbi:MAG TPA: apolipoprotein N-acyltransferase [Syntrophorhabdaceae bacterium]|jgi:apolipoprotein N-acyltransferase
MSHLIESIKKSPFSPAVASGLLLVLIQPPISLSFLAFFALIPLLYSIDRENLGRSFMAGCATGIVSFLGLLYWIIVAVHKYGKINIYLAFLILMLLICYLALYTGCFALAVAFCEKRLSIPFYLCAPALWVLFEYGRGSLLTGFPWSFLAHSQHNFLPLIQVISLTGAYFISFLIVAVNCILYGLWRRQRVSPIFIGITALLFAGSIGYGFIRMQGAGEGTLKAVIVQGNIKQDVKWDEAFKLNTIRTYYQATVGAGMGADLVVWPETAMPLIFDAEPYVKSHIGTLPVLTGARLLFGAISRDDGGRYYNSAYVLGKNGQEDGIYSKGHLVPFGEYTPLRNYLPFLEKLSVQIGEFFGGASHGPIRSGMGNVGVLICYEGIFPYITREAVEQGAQVLVNITNDAWYDRTSAPYQHLAFYVFRAIESDRFVLRAANTGISGVIDPRGRIHGRTSLFEPAVVTQGFDLRDSKTFYVRYGDYFVIITALFLACAVAARLIMRRKRPGPAYSGSK